MHRFKLLDRYAPILSMALMWTWLWYGSLCGSGMDNVTSGFRDSLSTKYIQPPEVLWSESNTDQMLVDIGLSLD